MLHKFLEKYKNMPVQMKASLWFLVCSFMQKGISVITTPIFTRLFTTAEYGQYSVFQSWMNIVTVFVSLNLSQGVYAQGLVKFESDRAKFVSSLQGLTLALVAGWTVVYLAACDFWNGLFSLTTVQMLSMLVLIWLSAVFHFWAAEQRVIYNYKTLVVLTLLVSVLQPCVGIIFVLYAEDKVLARIFGMVIVEFAIYIGLFFVQVCRGRRLFDGYYWKYALKFNIPLIPHYLSMTVLSSSDRIMITNLAGESEAGIYSLAYSLSLIMTLFNSALMNTLSPWIYQKIKDRREKEIAGVAYIAMAGIAGVNLLLMAFAPEAVRLFAPQEYYEAVWIIPPVAMSAYFMFTYDLFAKFQFYYEKTGYIMAASVCGAVLNIILNYIFIPVFGYYAAGYTTLACYMMFVMAHYLFMRKVCREYLDGIKVYDLKKLLGITAVFMCAGFVLMLLYRHTAVRYILFIIFTGILIGNRQKLAEQMRVLFSIKKK